MKAEIMIDIIFTLLSKKKVTTAEMAEKYGISFRTVYRYMEEISSEIPLYATHGPGGGYKIVDCYRLPASYFTEGEFAAVMQALSAFEREFPGGEIASAIDKIKVSGTFQSDLSLSTSSLIIDSGPWGFTADYNNKLRILEECVASSTAVRITYRNADGKRSERVVEPHTLVLKQGVWYVYAFCRTRGEFRLFKTGRIESQTVLSEKFKRRPTDSIGDALAFTVREDSILVRMKVEESAAMDVEEWLGVDCVKRTEDGVFAEATLKKSNGLVSKILGYGGGVKVVSPQSLRMEIASAAEKIVAAYSE